MHRIPQPDRREAEGQGALACVSPSATAVFLRGLCVCEGGSLEHIGKQIFTGTHSVFNLGLLSTGRHEIEPLPYWIHPLSLASVPAPDSHQHEVHWKEVNGFYTRHQELLKASSKILNNLPCCSYSTGRENEIYEKHDLSTQL